METEEFCGAITHVLENGINSYVVRIVEKPERGYRPLIMKSFGNGVSAEDFLLKVLCNPTFYKLQYS